MSKESDVTRKSKRNKKYFPSSLTLKTIYKHLYLYKAGFPKVGQVVPLGAITDTQGATSSKGVKGAALRS